MKISAGVILLIITFSSFAQSTTYVFVPDSGSANGLIEFASPPATSSAAWFTDNADHIITVQFEISGEMIGQPVTVTSEDFVDPYERFNSLIRSDDGSGLDSGDIYYDIPLVVDDGRLGLTFDSEAGEDRINYSTSLGFIEAKGNWVWRSDSIFQNGFEGPSSCDIDGVWAVEARDCSLEDCNNDDGRFRSWDGKIWCRALITQEWEDWVIEVPPAVTTFDFWVDWGAWDLNDCGDGESGISISACGMNERVTRGDEEKHLSCDVSGLEILSIVKEKDLCEYVIIGNPYFH